MLFYFVSRESCFGFFRLEHLFFFSFFFSPRIERAFSLQPGSSPRTKKHCPERKGERARARETRDLLTKMSQLPLAGVVALLASANSTAKEEAARARLQEKLADAGARVVARSSSRVSHAVVLLPPGASSSATALKQCITQEELRGLHGRLAGVSFFEGGAKTGIGREKKEATTTRERRAELQNRLTSPLAQNSTTTNRPAPPRTSSPLRGSTRADRSGRGSR